MLDRGLPMLVAVAAATCVLKERTTLGEALTKVAAFLPSAPLPKEQTLLLLPSRDAARSYVVTSSREGRPWTGVYSAYQGLLHQALIHQAEHGLYTAVVDCEGRPLDDIHDEITAHLAPYVHHPAHTERRRR